jgi:hypothetical protein
MLSGMHVPRSRLKPEERVNVAVYMSDVCSRVSANSIKDRNSKITEEDLIERLRERIIFASRRNREV